MHYVRCINNQTYVRMSGEPDNGALADLTLGAVYKVLPTAQHERDTGMIRIIDNSGEDYLYPASYFQPLDWDTVSTEWGSEPATLTSSPGPAHQSDSTRGSTGDAPIHGSPGASMDCGTA